MHKIKLTVFGRHLRGALDGKVNPKTSVTVTLFTRIDPETGHYESVRDRLNRFKTESEDALFKIIEIVDMTRDVSIQEDGTDVIVPVAEAA